MPLDELAEDLAASLALSVPLLLLVFALHKGWFPWVGFRKASTPREPPLWGWPEIILTIGAWWVTQVFVLALLHPLIEGSMVSRAAGVTLSLLASAGITTQVAFLLVRRRLGQPCSSVGLARTSWWNLPPTVLLCGAVILPIYTLYALWNLLLLHLFGYEPVTQELVRLYSDLVQTGDWVSVGLLVAAGTLIAPPVEEAIFRGLLFGFVGQRAGPVIGASVSSLIFAAIHFSLAAFVPLFTLGCVLCYLYHRTGSLYPAIAFHAIFNGVTFLGQIV